MHPTRILPRFIRGSRPDTRATARRCRPGNYASKNDTKNWNDNFAEVTLQNYFSSAGRSDASAFEIYRGRELRRVYEEIPE